MHEPASLVASWWSIAEANPTLLGAAVVVIGVAALALVGSRVLARVRRR
jgi:hypothetical protein